jgi:RNA polymerase sigma factor (sigma-70 family)
MMRMPTALQAAPLAGLALRCQPDARLVTLFRDGHDRAFEEIVRRYRQALVRFAAAIVPADRAEDVVQEALAKAHSSLAAGRGEISLRPWLYTIVRNRALNDLRDEPAHQPLAQDFDGVPQPPEVAARRTELASVVEQIKALPGAQREALLRRELEGRSHEEIAAAIGVSPGAARGLIFRARAALRDGAGALIPLPAMRALLNAAPLTTEATGAGIGGRPRG